MSRNEQYLKACCNKSGTNELPEPRSRIEALLYRLAEEISKGGGSDTSDATATAADIRKGKTAYVSDGLVVGTAGGLIRDLIVAMDMDCECMFSGFLVKSFVGVLEYEDTSSVTNMDSMFYDCSNLTTVPLFDTSSVTNMSSMFHSCSNLTTVLLFDTSSVTNMNTMLHSCSNLTMVPLFDTSSVTEMRGIFGRCSNLTTVPLFDTSSVTNMEMMFDACSNLTTVPSFDTRSVTNMGSMFRNCSNLTECWLRNIKVNLIVGSGTSYGHLLTLESLEHLIQELRNTGASRTLTVGSANLTKLANVYVKTIDITDEMRAEDDLIDEKLPFVVCESTDEGAMLITNYALEKNWTIA